MKKKFYCFIIFVLFLSTIFTGCDLISNINKEDVDPKQKEPVRLKFWIWDNVNDAQLRNVKMFNNTHDNIKVDLEVVAWDNYHNKLMNSISGGNGPDVFNMQVTWIPEFVDMDALMRLDNLIEDWPEKNDIYENIWSTIKDCAEEKIFAIPASMCTYYLYCRKDLFEYVGVKLPETIDEFYYAAEKLTIDTSDDEIIDVYGFGMRGTRMGHAMWMGITFADGPNKTTFFNKDGQVVLNNPQLIKATQRYIDLYKKGYTPMTAPKDGANEIQQNLLSGKTAMLIHHFGSAKVMDEKYGDNLAVIPIPKGEAGRVVPTEILVNGLLKNSKHKKEALEFMKWWASAESNDFISRNMGQTPIVKSVANLPFYQQNKFAKVSIDSLSDAYLVPPTPEMGMWTEEIWPREFQKALLGQISAEQFIENIANALKPIKNN